MWHFLWSVVSLSAALIALGAGFYFLAVTAWNAVGMVWTGIDTNNERSQFRTYLFEGGLALSVLIAALRALAMTLLFGAALVLFGASSGAGSAHATEFCGDRYCAVGGSYEKPRASVIDQSTRAGRKIARGITSRPNVEISRPVKVKADTGARKGTVIVLRGMGGYLPLGGMDALGAKIRAKGYRVIVSAPDFWASYRNERPAMIVGCSLGGTNALELARVVKNKPRVITIDPTRSNNGWRTRPNRGAPNGVAVINLYNPTNVLGGGYVKGAANYKNDIGHMAMCSAAPIHAIVLAHL